MKDLVIVSKGQQRVYSFKKEEKRLCIFAEKRRHWDLGHISKPDLNTLGSMWALITIQFMDGLLCKPVEALLESKWPTGLKLSSPDKEIKI